MKLIVQLALILTICLAGDTIAAILPFEFPSSVISMLLLLFLLITKRIREEQIQELSDFLLQNMAFFFIPAGVSIMEHLHLFRQGAAAFLLVCLLTTIIGFGVTAAAISFLLRLQERMEEKKHD